MTESLLTRKYLVNVIFCKAKYPHLGFIGGSAIKEGPTYISSDGSINHFKIYCRKLSGTRGFSIDCPCFSGCVFTAAVPDTRAPSPKYASCADCLNKSPLFNPRS